MFFCQLINQRSSALTASFSLAPRKTSWPVDRVATRCGRDAIRDYLTHERATDAEHFDSPALFLASRSRRNTDGRLSVRSINTIWNATCAVAGVEGKTPHSARHAMGRHIIEKTGNVSAVQRQFGHKNAAYSLQYTRITAEEMDSVLNDRE